MTQKFEAVNCSSSLTTWVILCHSWTLWFWRQLNLESAPAQIQSAEIELALRTVGTWFLEQTDFMQVVHFKTANRLKSNFPKKWYPKNLFFKKYEELFTKYITHMDGGDFGAQISWWLYPIAILQFDRIVWTYLLYPMTLITQNFEFWK